MNNVYIKTIELSDSVSKYFDKKDLISIDDLIECIDNLNYEIEKLKEENEDLKQESEESK